MYKIRMLLLVMVMFVAQQTFADDAMNTTGSNEGKPCATIAKACLKAGYKERQTATKQFWDGCMKPLILGQTVKGVTIDTATVQACRDNKIAELKRDLEDLQKAS